MDEISRGPTRAATHKNGHSHSAVRTENWVTWWPRVRTSTGPVKPLLCVCGPGASHPGFSKSLPLYIFNVNTKTSSDCAEIILIPHSANFTWRKSPQEWAGGRGRGAG